MLGCMCTSLFGFLRCVEFTVPSQSGYDPSTHLSLNDMAIDSANSPVFDSGVNKTVQDRPFLQRCSALPGQDRQEYLPYYSHNALPGIARPQARPTIPLPRRELSHTTRFYHLAAHNSLASRLRRQPVCSPQF